MFSCILGTVTAVSPASSLKYEPRCVPGSRDRNYITKEESSRRTASLRIMIPREGWQVVIKISLRVKGDFN